VLQCRAVIVGCVCYAFLNNLMFLSKKIYFPSKKKVQIFIVYIAIGHSKILSETVNKHFNKLNSISIAKEKNWPVITGLDGHADLF